MSLPCPKCGHRTRVYDHRIDKHEEQHSAKRYRKCESCGGRFVSVETFVEKSHQGRGHEPWYMQGAFD